MLWTCAIILQALSVLSEETRSAYLSPIIEKFYRERDYAGDRGSNPQNIFDIRDHDGKVEPSEYGVPTWYFLITHKGIKPSERDCVNCLIKLFGDQSFLNPCECLPCSIKITSSDFTFPWNLFRYYKQFTCDPQKRLRNDFSDDFKPFSDKNNRREIHVMPAVWSYDEGEEGRTGKNKAKTRMENADNLQPTMQPQLSISFRSVNGNTESEREVPLWKPFQKRMRKIGVDSSEGKRSEEAVNVNLAERNDSQEESYGVSPEKNRGHVKQKVRRVLSEILSRMDKINKAPDIQKVSESPSDIPMHRTGFVSEPKEGKRRSGLGKYRHPYQRPTYQVLQVKDKTKDVPKSLKGKKDNLKSETVVKNDIEEVTLQKPWQRSLEHHEFEDDKKNISIPKSDPIQWKSYNHDDSKNKGIHVIENTKHDRGTAPTYAVLPVAGEETDTGKTPKHRISVVEGTVAKGGKVVARETVGKRNEGRAIVRGRKGIDWGDGFGQGTERNLRSGIKWVEDTEEEANNGNKKEIESGGVSLVSGALVGKPGMEDEVGYGEDTEDWKASASSGAAGSEQGIEDQEGDSLDGENGRGSGGSSESRGEPGMQNKGTNNGKAIEWEEGIEWEIEDSEGYGSEWGVEPNNRVFYERGAFDGSAAVASGVEDTEDGELNVEEGTASTEGVARAGIEDGELNIEEGTASTEGVTRAGIEDGELNIEEGTASTEGVTRAGIEDEELNVEEGTASTEGVARAGIEDEELNVEEGAASTEGVARAGIEDEELNVEEGAASTEGVARAGIEDDELNVEEGTASTEGVARAGIEDDELNVEEGTASTEGVARAGIEDDELNVEEGTASTEGVARAGIEDEELNVEEGTASTEGVARAGIEDGAGVIIQPRGGSGSGTGVELFAGDGQGSEWGEGINGEERKNTEEQENEDVKDEEDGGHEGDEVQETATGLKSEGLALANNGHNYRLKSNLLMSNHPTKEETKNTPSVGNSGYGSTTPLEQKWMKTENTRLGITPPTTMKYHRQSVVTDVAETLPHGNRILPERNENISLTKYDKNRADPVQAMPKYKRVTKKKTKSKPTKERDLPPETTPARSVEETITDSKQPNKSTNFTTQREFHRTYGDHLTINLPKKNSSNATNAEEVKTSNPDTALQRNQLRSSPYFTKTDSTTRAPKDLFPDGVKEYSPRQDDSINFREGGLGEDSKGEDLQEVEEKKKIRFGTRSTMSYLLRMTEAPFRRDENDRESVNRREDPEYMSSYKSGPSYVDRASKKASGKVTAQEKPKLVIEFEEQPRKKQNDPAINIKLNIYSDTDPDNVYRFLSRLIPRRVEDEHLPSLEEDPTRKIRSEPYRNFGYNRNFQNRKGGLSVSQVSANARNTGPRPRFRRRPSSVTTTSLLLH